MLPGILPQLGPEGIQELSKKAAVSGPLESLTLTISDLGACPPAGTYVAVVCALASIAPMWAASMLCTGASSARLAMLLASTACLNFRRNAWPPPSQTCMQHSFPKLEFNHELRTLQQSGAAGGHSGLADIQEDEDDGARFANPAVLLVCCKAVRKPCHRTPCARMFMLPEVAASAVWELALFECHSAPMRKVN